jgi:uncharacterized membrane protein
MNRAKLTGAVLATAVALSFMGSAAIAADDSAAAGSQVKCVAGNACKGQSACKSAASDCKGQNACKGKGYVMMSSAKECTDAGGKAEEPKKE